MVRPTNFSGKSQHSQRAAYSPTTWSAKIKFDWRPTPRPRATKQGTFPHMYNETWYNEYLAQLSDVFDNQENTDVLQNALKSPYGFRITLVVYRQKTNGHLRPFLSAPDVDNVAKGIVDALIASQTAQNTRPIGSDVGVSVNDQRMIQLVIRKEYTDEPSFFVIQVAGEDEISNIEHLSVPDHAWTQNITYDWRHSPRPKAISMGKFANVIDEPWYPEYLDSLANVFSTQPNQHQLQEALASANGFNVDILVKRNHQDDNRPFLREPDVDNIAKGIIDALMRSETPRNTTPVNSQKKTTLVDDRRLIQLFVRKQYTSGPSCFEISIKGDQKVYD